MPKSARTARNVWSGVSGGLSRMFAGLTSRWMMPAWWTTCRASPRSAATDAASRGATGPLAIRDAERAAVDVLHHEVRPGIGGQVGVEQRHERGVVHRGEKSLLGLAAHRVGILGRAGPEDLDRDRAAESLVGGAPDGSHAALADQLFEPIAFVEHFSGLGRTGDSQFCHPNHFLTRTWDRHPVDSAARPCLRSMRAGSGVRSALRSLAAAVAVVVTVPAVVARSRVRVAGGGADSRALWHRRPCRRRRHPSAGAGAGSTAGSIAGAGSTTGTVCSSDVFTVCSSCGSGVG